MRIEKTEWHSEACFGKYCLEIAPPKVHYRSKYSIIKNRIPPIQRKKMICLLKGTGDGEYVSTTRPVLKRLTIMKAFIRKAKNRPVRAKTLGLSPEFIILLFHSLPDVFESPSHFIFHEEVDANQT